MIRKLFVVLAALIPASLQAQTAQPAQPLWTVTDARHALIPAGVSLPRTAASLTVAQTRDLRPDGGDSNLLYRSSDGQVIATAYLYYPGLAHSGLSAYATDSGIRENSRSPIEALGTRVVDAGGVTGAAIRIDYRNYMGANASTAAFVKAGRWIIKFRVTGPEARRGEVMAAMDALLANVRFNPASPARPAAPLAVSDCPAGAAQRDAALIENEEFAQLTAHGILALVDGAGEEARNENGTAAALPSRIPSTMCVSSRIGQARVPILRPLSATGESPSGRTRAIVILSDSGTMLEIVQALTTPTHVLLYHQIGSTSVLGSFDAMPSDRQITAFFTERNNPATQVRVPIRLHPNGDTDMTLPSPEAERPAPGT